MRRRSRACRSASRAARSSRSFRTARTRASSPSARPSNTSRLEETIAAREVPNALFVVLDHITDPHNAGAIIRSAECAGATAVVMPERRAAGVNATVRKSAAGATAHLPIARVANVAGALRTMKKAGVWIAGSASAADALDYTAADFRRRPRDRDRQRRRPASRRSCARSATSSSRSRCTAALNASVAAGIGSKRAVNANPSPDVPSRVRPVRVGVRVHRRSTPNAATAPVGRLDLPGIDSC
jgi:hypothetical protein